MDNNKEITRKAHDAIANTYYDLYKDDESDLMYFDEFLNNCGKLILDLGCGMGHYSKYIKTKGYEVTGIDFSSEMIAIARRTNPNIKFYVSDICDIDKLDLIKYDGIVISYVLQHLSKSEVQDVFKNINKYLNPKAKIILFIREGSKVLTEKEPINPNYTYIINEYSSCEINELLLNNGWNNIKIVKKEQIDDHNSLAPNTLVVFANK